MAKRPFLAKHVNSEHHQQATFYSLLSRVNHPAVQLTVAIPNQAVALLTKAAAVHFKAEGVKAGFPDNVCFYPSPHTSGLWVAEFKRPGEKPRKNQVALLKLLAAAGHNCHVFDDARAAFRSWQDHLGIVVGF